MLEFPKTAEAIRKASQMIGAACERAARLELAEREAAVLRKLGDCPAVAAYRQNPSVETASLVRDEWVRRFGRGWVDLDYVPVGFTVRQAAAGPEEEADRPITVEA